MHVTARVLYWGEPERAPGVMTSTSTTLASSPGLPRLFGGKILMRQITSGGHERQFRPTTAHAFEALSFSSSPESHVYSFRPLTANVFQHHLGRVGFPGPVAV